MKDDRPLVAVTMGDPAGVGPELCLRALGAPQLTDACIPVVLGDYGILHRVAKTCGLPPATNVVSLAEWQSGITIKEPTVVDFGGLDAESIVPGKIQPACGQAAFNYIQEGIRAAQGYRVAAVATGPINKQALHQAGIDYPGHTEIFTTLTGTPSSCMMLTAEEITVSFVTTHCGYEEVVGKLSVDRISKVINLTAAAMTAMRGRSPRLVVCGLNPHAGEQGLFGDQESRFIAPAIELAKQQGFDVEGPLPPDAAFIPQRRIKTDAYICLYHDQGHIPFKMLAFDTGVNVTLGLPIVRTSVDHGTAFDIAWKGLAKPISLFCAIHLAVRLAKGSQK